MSDVCLLPLGPLQLDINETAAELCCLVPCAVARSPAAMVHLKVAVGRAGGRILRLPAPHVHTHSGEAKALLLRNTALSIPRSSRWAPYFSTFQAARVPGRERHCESPLCLLLEGHQHAPLCTDSQSRARSAHRSSSRPRSNTGRKELQPAIQPHGLHAKLGARCSPPPGAPTATLPNLQAAFRRSGRGDSRS